MELRYKLEKIFNDDYPGTERFIADVIKPIFGNEIEDINDDLAEREKYAEKAKNAGIKHIRYVGNLTEKNYNADNIALLDVTLDDSKNIERSRVNIQQLIRSIMDYHQHLMIVFHYEDVANKQWRFSYAYKGGSLKDTTSAKRYTYVFGKGYRGRTAAERFQTLANSPRNNEDFENAFSVSKLSDDFFDEYRAYYAAFVEFITGERYTDEKDLLKHLNSKEWLRWKQKDSSGQFESTFRSEGKSVRDYIKKMFGRIVFIYFLQRKGWLYDANGNPDAHYMRHLFDGAGTLQTTFLDDVLEVLFFYVLNTKPEQRITEASLAHKDITTLPGWEKIPFLNGGLFSQDDIDPKRCVFPAVYFDELFRFLDSYNFTIDENDQEDAEIGIDPEMLGRIFENLLEDNKDKGAFYTPKEIVDYMCRESIIAYLQDDKFSKRGNELIRKFIETLNIDLLDTTQRDYIEAKLLKVKICDPAIGSGAFPMGLVNLLSKVFIVLRTYKTIDQAKMKRYIMQNSIYGVDIEQGAVDIARLRFWLAMVVEENEPQPLPNLHFKIMQGNSLLESYKGRDLSDLTTFQAEVEPGTFDFGPNHESVELNNLLRLYYGESDHAKRTLMLTSIKHNVIRQMLGKGMEIEQGVDITSNDQFFLWHTWFADIFENGGFDIVIGNPPYKIISSEEKLVYKFPIMEGHVDLYELFIQLSYALAKEKGVVMLIHPNTLLTNLYSERLRKFLTSKFGISEITNFSMDVFQTPVVHTCITKCQKNIESKLISIRKSVRSFNELSLPYDFELAISDITNSSSYTFDITLNEFERALFHKINKYPKLGDICYLRQCIKTGNDKEYVRVSDIPLPSPWKKSLRGKGIVKYHVKEHNLYIKYGDWLARNWSNTSFYERKKIAIREAGKFITACIDEDNSYFLSSIYAVYPKQEYNERDLFFLLGLLNSKFATFYVTKIAFDFTEGAFTKMRTNQLARLPVNSNNQNLKEMIENKTEHIIHLKKHSIESDTTDLENQIDNIVYHLYGLTYDEVLLIDPQLPLSREEYENLSLNN